MSQQLTTPWKNLPRMTTIDGGCAAVTLKGKLFAIGGFNIGIEFYDINERRWRTEAPSRMSQRCDSWTEAPSRMSQRRDSCAVAAIGNSVYVAGGTDWPNRLSSAEAFDIGSGLWRTLPPMSTVRDKCAGVAVGDEFLVFGGYDDSNMALDTAESFNVRTGRWSDLPNMNNRRSCCAAAVINDRVYVIGGRDETRLVFDTVDVFDLKTRTWTLLPHRMATKRCGCAAAAVGNYLVIVGGHDGTTGGYDDGTTEGYDGGYDDSTIKLKTVEAYNVDTERWTELPSMSTERDGCAAVSSGGSVYVMGGLGNSVYSELCYGDYLEVYHNSVEEIQFNDDIVKGMLMDWSRGSWSDDVVPILHRRASVIHRLDVDVTVMPTLLSRVGHEERVQTIFEVVRGEIGIFKHTYVQPKRC